jgi:uncharacterized protein
MRLAWFIRVQIRGLECFRLSCVLQSAFLGANMDFEYDEEKSAKCQDERGFGFKDMVGVFKDPLGFDLESKKDGHDKRRYLRLGSLKGVIFAVIWTPREGRVRIISARRAKRKERKAYEAHRKD